MDEDSFVSHALLAMKHICLACEHVMFVAKGCKGYVIQKGWYQNWQVRMANGWVKRGWLAHAVLAPRNTKRKGKTK